MKNHELANSAAAAPEPVVAQPRPQATRTLELPKVLGPILQATLQQLNTDQRALPAAALMRQVARAPAVRSLGQALTAAGPRLKLIAEFKPRSPSRGWLRQGANPVEFAQAYHRAAAISVLCDRDHFGGGLALLQAFRPLAAQPLLAKGFFVDPYQLAQVRALGADAALLIARLLPGPQLAQMLRQSHELGLETLVEVHTLRELEQAVAAGAPILGVNARDLDTLTIDLVGCRELLRQAPADRVRVAESGLETREGVDDLREFAAAGHVNAVLIGTALMTAADPEAAVTALGFP